MAATHTEKGFRRYINGTNLPFRLNNVRINPLLTWCNRAYITMAPWRGVCSKRLIWILLRTLRGKLVWQLKLLLQIQQGKKTSFELNEIRRNGRYSLPLSQGATSRQSTAYGADKRLKFQLRSSSAVAPPPQRKDPELGKDRQNICITVAYREWRCCGYKM